MKNNRTTSIPLAAVAAVLILPAAAISYASSAHADPGQAGLGQPFSVAGGPFVGQWGAHGEALTINAGGTAVTTSRSARRSTAATSTAPTAGRERLIEFSNRVGSFADRRNAGVTSAEPMLNSWYRFDRHEQPVQHRQRGAAWLM